MFFFPGDVVIAVVVFVVVDFVVIIFVSVVVVIIVVGFAAAVRSLHLISFTPLLPNR